MGVIARHRSMEDWSISLGNTLLASIVCLLWYVFGLWEEADIKVSEEAALTSAEKKVRSVDKEEKLNNGSDHLCTSRTEGEGHLYMLPEEGRQLLVEQSKQRQEEIQSAMQLKEEKAPIEPKEKKTTTTSQEAGLKDVPVATECRSIGVGRTNRLYCAFQCAGGQTKGSWDLQDRRC